MLRSLRLHLILLATLLPGAVGAEERWSQLKLGMTADETLSTLGRPMLRSSGKGFELWVYDNGAEAVFYGSLIGWTVPTTARASERSTDIWSEDESGENHVTFLSLLPQPSAPPPAKQKAPPPSTGRRDDVWLPYYTLRHL